MLREFFLQSALVMQRFGLWGSADASPVTTVGRDNFSDLFVDGIPIGFEGLLPNPDLDRPVLERLWQRMGALIRLRGELYNPEREENTVLTMVRTTADLAGLAVFHEADRLVEARARSGDTQGEQRGGLWHHATHS